MRFKLMFTIAGMSCLSAFAEARPVPFVELPPLFNGVAQTKDYLKASELLIDCQLNEYSTPETLDTWRSSEIPERTYIHDVIESVLSADIARFKGLHRGAADRAESDYAKLSEVLDMNSISDISDLLVVRELRIANYICYGVKIGANYSYPIVRDQLNGFHFGEHFTETLGRVVRYILIASQHQPELVASQSSMGMSALDLGCATRSEECNTTIYFPTASFFEFVPLLLQRKFVFLSPSSDLEGEEEATVAEDFPLDVTFCRDTWQLVSECARENTFRSSRAFDAFRLRVNANVESVLDQIWIREAAINDHFVRQFNLQAPNVRLVYTLPLGNYVIYFMSTYLSDDDPNVGSIQPINNYWVDVAKRSDSSLEYVTFLEFGSHFLKDFFEQMSLQSSVLDMINANVAGN